MAGEGIRQLSGKQFAVHPGTFDACKDDDFEYKTGHTYKRYYLKWTGTEFKEYVGKKITQKDFKEYKNGSSVLSKIKKAGYKVGKIYKRSNGIININCSKKDGSTTYYENVTVKLKEGKVKVVVCYKDGDNYVTKSSYGGSYEAKGYNV